MYCPLDYTLSIEHSFQRCRSKLLGKATTAVVIAVAQSIKLLSIHQSNYTHLILVKQVSMTISDMDFTFVDVQGFKIHDGIFVPKEFCLLHKDFEFHTIVKSPCKYTQLSIQHKREADWLTNRYHGLNFNEGTISINALAEFTLEHVKGKVVIVKGIEKVKWVRDIYKKWCNTTINCVNIERTDPIFQFQLKSRRNIDDICPYHKLQHRFTSCHCALSHTIDLRKLLMNESIDFSS